MAASSRRLRALLLGSAALGFTATVALAQRASAAQPDSRPVAPTLIAYGGIHHPTGELFPSSTGTPGVRTGNALQLGGRLEIPLARRAGVQVDLGLTRPPLRYREEDDVPTGRANLWTMTARLAYHVLPIAGPITMALSGGAGLVQFEPESIYDMGESWPVAVVGMTAGARVTRRWTVVMVVDNYLYRAQSGSLRARQHDVRAGLGLRFPL